MKKILLLLLVFICALVVACGENYDKVLNDALSKISVSSEVSEDITLVKEVEVDGVKVSVTWSSDSSALTSEGKVTRGEEDVLVKLVAKAEVENSSKEKEFSVKVLKKESNVNYEEIVMSVLEKLYVVKETSENIPMTLELEERGYKVKISWSSDNAAITKDGVVTRGEEDVVVNLKATATLEGVSKEKVFEVKVLKEVAKVDFEEIATSALEKLEIVTSTDKDLDLVKEVEVAGYKVAISYESNNNALTSDGIVTRGAEDVLVSLKAVATVEGVSKEKVFEVTVLKEEVKINYEELAKAMLEKIELPLVVDGDLDLVKEVTEQGVTGTVKYAFSTEMISEDGKVTMFEEDESTLDCVITLTLNDANYTKEVKGITVLSIIGSAEKFIKSLNIPSEIDDNINLPTEHKNMEISWSTSNKYILTDKGVAAYVEEDTEVTLYVTCLIYYNDEEYFYDDRFELVIKPYSDEKRVNLVYNSLSIPTETIDNIGLLSTYSYGVKATWTSSNEKVISTNGVVTPDGNETVVTLKVVLSYGGVMKEQTFDVKVGNVPLDGCDELFYMHNLVEYAEDLDSAKLTNLELVDGRIQLKEGAVEGVYESKTFKTRKFDSVVGSYSCTSGLDHTAELEVSLKVKGVWSKYYTYGRFGNGRNNLYYDTSDTYTYLNTDIVTVNSGYQGEGVKYRITLRRDSADAPSPKLLLVAIAFRMSDYTYVVDDSDLPKEFDNASCPKLYQHDVPTIGGVICSATTTTMLLMNRGYDFSNRGYDLPHAYMASIVADRGHNNPTYGNWSYNMIAAGGFGAEAYVAKLYSWEELKWYLVNVGPCGASIGGYFGAYTTNGHLIVVRGYRETENGTTVICNDPNIKGVYYEVSKEIFMEAWKKGMSYIVK